MLPWGRKTLAGHAKFENYLSQVQLGVKVFFLRTDQLQILARGIYWFNGLLFKTDQPEVKRNSTKTVLTEQCFSCQNKTVYQK